MTFNFENPAYTFHAGTHIFYSVTELVQVSIRNPFSVIAYDNIQFIVHYHKSQLGLRGFCMLQNVVQGFLYRIKDISSVLPVNRSW